MGARRRLKMATGSGASSASGSRGSTGQPPAGGQTLCPFCRTATIVEQTSRTAKNPNKQFYTCRNRELGNNRCNFFMWKPMSDGGEVDAASVMAGLDALEKSLFVLRSSIEAQSLNVSRIARQQRVDRWLNVASVFVGVVCFVVLCIFMQKQE